jgi:multicomponent Na+:H+ antiporter subunit A
MLLAAVLTLLLGAPLLALLPLALRRYAWLLAALPGLLFVLLCMQVPTVVAGEVLREELAWVPGLELSLSLMLDGLALLFALLISGIGTLIVLYAAGYMADDARAWQFHACLLFFMGAMLGLVLADNMLALFVFWELTTYASFLLVGFKYQTPKARTAARMALVITAGGGLALLGGLVLLGQVAGSYELSDVLVQAPALRADALYGLIVALILLGCFTKSAQFPFHFWLPGAMTAPTPASAYLHSATMVKAGVYLVARLSPGLGGTLLWDGALLVFGLVTLVIGVVAALGQNDLKGILAYTTVSQLGMLTALVGLGAAGAKALVVGILSHALYKAALFLTSGNIEHATHTRNLSELGSLRRALPYTGAAVALASLSMAGVPPLIGFLSKEKALAAFWYEGGSFAVVTGAVLGLGALLLVAVALRLIWEGFWRQRATPYEHAPHEAGPLLLVGPLVLASLSLLILFVPGVEAMLGAAVASMGGSNEPVPLVGALWTGVNAPLLISVAALVLGAALFGARGHVIPLMKRLGPPIKGAAVFERALSELQAWAHTISRPMETLRLRHNILLIFVIMIALAGWGVVFWSPLQLQPVVWGDLPLATAIVMLLIPVAAMATVFANTRLKAIAALGIVGAVVALLFALFSAPDLALTQLLVETLTIVFMLLAFARLPRRLVERASTLVRARDTIIAVASGALMTMLMLLAAAPGGFPGIHPYYIDNSLPLAFGANVVNVILVDFRGYDTLGEIVVLAAAALGAYSVIRANRSQPAKADRSDNPLVNSEHSAEQPHAGRYTTSSEHRAPEEVTR